MEWLQLHLKWLQIHKVHLVSSEVQWFLWSLETHTFIISQCAKSFHGFKSFLNFQIWWIYFLKLSHWNMQMYKCSHEENWKGVFFTPIIDFGNIMSVCVFSLDISFTHFIHTDCFNDDFVEHWELTNCVLSTFLGTLLDLQQFSYVKFPTTFTLMENFLGHAQTLTFSWKNVSLL